MKTSFWCIALLALPASDEFTLAPLKDAPPEEIPAALRKELAPEGTRVARGGKPYMDFWLRAALPASPAQEQLNVLFPEIKPGSFIGAVRVHGPGTDFRDHKFPAGVYTLRYAVQPEDGDHQGTSESRDFLLLCPPAHDASPDALPHADVVKLALKVPGRKHPAVLWLMASEAGAKQSKITHDEPKERVILETGLPVGAKDGKRLGLGIVVVGKAPE